MHLENVRDYQACVELFESACETLIALQGRADACSFIICTDAIYTVHLFSKCFPLSLDSSGSEVEVPERDLPLPYISSNIDIQSGHVLSTT